MNTRNILLLLGIVVITAIMFRDDDPKVKPQRVSATKNYIVNAFDASGTVKGEEWPWPVQSFFENEITFLEEHGGGILEVYNFSFAVPRSIKIKIKPMVKIPNVYAGEKAVKNAKERNRKAKKQNDIAKEVFWKQIKRRILNYSPNQKNDFSYINKNCLAILKSLKLQHYADYQKNLLLYTDFKDHEPGSEPKLLDTSLLQELSNVSTLSVCYHGNEEIDIEAINLPNYDEFIGVLKSTL